MVSSIAISLSPSFSCATYRIDDAHSNAFEDPTILGSALEPVELIAQCDGLLPATVVMAARDTSELFSLSRQIISISYRLGCEIRRRMRLVDSRLECWGRTYAGITGDRMQDILDEFHDSQVMLTKLGRQELLGGYLMSTCFSASRICERLI